MVADASPALGTGSNRAGRRRRQQILDVAERLVRERGHHAVTMQAVATAVGITQPAIHHHFATRDHLFVALLAHRDATAPERELDDAWDAMIEGVRASTETPRLVALLADYASKAADPAHPAHEYFAHRYASIIDGLATSIRRRQSEGRMPADLDPARVATILHAVADGLQTRWLIDPAVDMPATFSAAAAQYLTPGAGG